MEDRIKNPILHLCEAIENSDLADKKELRTEIKTIVWDLGEYFDHVVNQQMHFYTTPPEELDESIVKLDDERRRYLHDYCVNSCRLLNEICSKLNINKICDFDTDDHRKVAGFCGYISLYIPNIVVKNTVHAFT